MLDHRTLLAMPFMAASVVLAGAYMACRAISEEILEVGK